MGAVDWVGLTGHNAEYGNYQPAPVIPQTNPPSMHQKLFLRSQAVTARLRGVRGSIPATVRIIKGCRGLRGT